MDATFIGGCPRSGTTWVGYELGRRTGAVVTPESQFKTDLLSDPDADSISVQECVARIERNARFRLWSVGADGLMQHLRPDELSLIGRPAIVAAVQAAVRFFAASYGEQPAAWIDHTPNNVKLGNELALRFPTARFVHIVRDPRAVAASLLRVDWGPSSALVAAQTWMMEMGAGVALALRMPDRVEQVRFEDLLVDRADEWERLAGSEPLPSEHATELPSTPPDFYARRYHTLVGRPPQEDRVDAWRSELDPRSVSIVESICSPFMELFNYERTMAPHRFTTRDRLEAYAKQAYAEVRPSKQMYRWRIRRGRTA